MKVSSYVVSAVLHVLAFYNVACFGDRGQLARHRRKLISLKLHYFSFFPYSNLKRSRIMFGLGLFSETMLSFYNVLPEESKVMCISLRFKTPHCS